MATGSYAICEFYIDGVRTKEEPFMTQSAHFDLTTLDLSVGTHLIAATLYPTGNFGYAESDFSNTVVYTVESKTKSKLATPELVIDYAGSNHQVWKLLSG